MGMIFTELVRWIFVVLAFFVIARSIRSLLQTKSPSEVWAYLHMVTLKPAGDGSYLEREQRVPLTHWENVLGRAKSCDVTVGDGTMSRNHAILMRDMGGNWHFQDLGSKNGSWINDHRVVEAGCNVPVKFGDSIRLGLTTCTLMPVSLEEKNNNRNMRRSDTQHLSAGPALAALTLFQLLAVFQLVIALPDEAVLPVIMAFGGLALLMWIYTGFLRMLKQTAFEMDMIAFFLCTLNLAVVASSNYNALRKQLIAIALGVAVMFVMCVILRNLTLTKYMRWLLLTGAVALLIFNLAFGSMIFGAKNWIQIGAFSFQPSELVKVAFIWIGAATLDELFTKKNLTVFMMFSGFCFCCLAVMGDFGTAIIFFITFVVISFLRSGDFSKMVLFLGAAFAGGLIILRFKPYIANRFASWGHVWEPAFVDAAGYQQSRAMSAAASGGLVGVGAGEGWLESVPAADTDMVFCMLIEEWGLIIAMLAVFSIVTLAVFSVRSIMGGRSTFYTIGACGAMSMFVFQTMLNVFGAVDLLPFTGVTFPFVSNGGTSMIVSWALLAFLKSADTRERASIAVKAGDRL